MNIKNCTVLVTGGASGLGAATARQIVKAGGNVAIFDRQQEKGAALAAELGDKVIFCLTDVTQEESVNDSIAKAKEQFGAMNLSPLSRQKIGLYMVHSQTTCLLF